MKKGQKVYRKFKTHWTNHFIVLRVYKNKIQIKDTEGNIEFEFISNICNEYVFFNYYHIN